MSESSRSDASSLIRSKGPLCKCGRTTTILKSWTDDNPGRRFFRCAVHGFFNWADEDKPHGWQKLSLMEARDEIRRQKDEIKVLKESLRVVNEQVLSGSTTNNTDLADKHEEEKKKLEIEVMAANEREKMMRQFILLSWGGFIVVTAMILVMGK